jgi:hypothetical protein
MTRAEKIDFLIRAVYAIEGVIISSTYYESCTDEQLDKEVDWYDYLLHK